MCLCHSLPIVQGGSFAFLPATFQIIFNAELQAIEDDSERFNTTMRVIQGAVIVSGVIQFVIGYTGIVTIFLKFVGPVTIAPVIAAIGLGLYGVAFNGVAACWSLGLLQLFTVVLFSQYMKAISIGGIKVFGLFPVVFAIAFTWSFGAILTAADVWEEGNACRTDSNGYILDETPWLRIPYPFQWGMPIFRTYAWVPMLGGMLASMIESIGDYYSCANLAGAPPPTPGIVSRGLGSEAIGVIISGLIGTTNATTSYSENIGAISITGVGSRVVVQVRISHLNLTILVGYLLSNTIPSSHRAVWSSHHHCCQLYCEGWCIIRYDAQLDDIWFVLCSFWIDRCGRSFQFAIRRPEQSTKPIHYWFCHFQFLEYCGAWRVHGQSRVEPIRIDQLG